jgi:hypothetical protein
MPLRLLLPPHLTATSLLTPTIPYLARLHFSHAPTIPLLLELLLAFPGLLTPPLSHLLLSHSQPLPALSLYHHLLALPHFPVPESSLPVLLRLLVRSRRYAHLSFLLLESLPSTHPHLLSCRLPLHHAICIRTRRVLRHRRHLLRLHRSRMGARGTRLRRRRAQRTPPHLLRPWPRGQGPSTLPPLLQHLPARHTHVQHTAARVRPATPRR